MNNRIDTLLIAATEEFKKLPPPACESARLDAELLMSHTLKKPRSYLYTWPEITLSKNQCEIFHQQIKYRSTGVPTAYLIGEKNFWSLKLKVNEHVLIPRPDTELLVETALSITLPNRILAADLGTGSGAIALALAHERPNWQIYAVDQNPNAIITAKENASANKISNVSFLTGNWCQPLKDMQFHIIITNPPYISEDDYDSLRGDVLHEPTRALTSGKDGLDDIKQIITQSISQLLPKGWLLIEHGFNQGKAVKQLMAKQNFNNIDSKKDFAGHERMTFGQRHSSFC